MSDRAEHLHTSVKTQSRANTNERVDEDPVARLNLECQRCDWSRHYYDTQGCGALKRQAALEGGGGGGCRG